MSMGVMISILGAIVNSIDWFGPQFYLAILFGPAKKGGGRLDVPLYLESAFWMNKVYSGGGLDFNFILGLGFYNYIFELGKFVNTSHFWPF